MDTADWPEWCVRQPAPADRAACVWVHAPTATAAAAFAADRLGLLGGWRTDVELEIFPAEQYRERAGPRDYTRAVLRSAATDAPGAPTSPDRPPTR